MIEKIKSYCKIKDFNSFNLLQGKKVFNHETKTLNIVDGCVFYVDWREYDDAIVEYCENLIKTGSLKAKKENNYILIKYKGDEFELDLTDTNSLDPTIKFVNKILLPEYEIRFCTITAYCGDDLAFIILSKNQWKQIESEFTKKEIDEIFEPINDNTRMFEKEF